MWRSRVFVGALLLIASTQRMPGDIASQLSESGTDDQAILDTILAGCKQAAYAIQSGKGTVLVRDTWYEYEPEGKLVTLSKYSVVFSGDRFKYECETTYLENTRKLPEGYDNTMMRRIAPGEKLREIVSYDGEKVVAFYPDGRTAQIRGGKECGSERANFDLFLSPMLKGLADVVGIPSHVKLGFEVEKINFLGRKRLGNQECFVVEVVTSKKYAQGQETGVLRCTNEFWIDPKKGYTIPVWREWDEGGPKHQKKTLSHEVFTEMRKYGDVWGPAKCTMIQYDFKAPEGTKRVGCEIEVVYDEGFKFNVPVSRKDLEISIPRGTMVDDRLLAQLYKKE